jgi:hypothetical protein
MEKSEHLIATLVRPCKYCIFWRPIDLIINGKQVGSCDRKINAEYNPKVSETDFCSYGLKYGEIKR